MATVTKTAIVPLLILAIIGLNSAVAVKGGLGPIKRLLQCQDGCLEKVKAIHPLWDNVYIEARVKFPCGWVVDGWLFTKPQGDHILPKTNRASMSGWLR